MHHLDSPTRSPKLNYVCELLVPRNTCSDYNRTFYSEYMIPTTFPTYYIGLWIHFIYSFHFPYVFFSFSKYLRRLVVCPCDSLGYSPFYFLPDSSDVFVLSDFFFTFEVFDRSVLFSSIWEKLEISFCARVVYYNRVGILYITFI